MCRIDVGGVEDAVAYQLDSTVLTRQAVNATEFGEEWGVVSEKREGLTGTDSHTVVLAEDKVNVTQVAVIILNGLDGTFLRPVALQSSNNLNVWKILQGIGKAIVTFDGW